MGGQGGQRRGGRAASGQVGGDSARSSSNNSSRSRARSVAGARAAHGGRALGWCKRARQWAGGRVHDWDRGPVFHPAARTTARDWPLHDGRDSRFDLEAVKRQALHGTPLLAVSLQHPPRSPMFAARRRSSSGQHRRFAASRPARLLRTKLCPLSRPTQRTCTQGSCTHASCQRRPTVASALAAA